MSALGFTYGETEILRRAQLTLHHWSEAEANGEIQREGDDGTGKPRRYYGRDMDKSYPTADREAGALRRIAEVMETRNSRAWVMSGETGEYHPKRGNTATDLVSYYQGDCRGCALYLVPKAELHGQDIAAVYNRGFAVCVD